MKVMTIPQLKRWQQDPDPFLLVNVLNEDLFNQGHIPGSVNVPSGDHRFEQRIEAAAGGRSQPVVLYCSDAECTASAQAAIRLEHDGFANVYHLRVGLQGWAAEGLPVERERTTRAQA